LPWFFLGRKVHFTVSQLAQRLPILHGHGIDRLGLRLRCMGEAAESENVAPVEEQAEEESIFSPHSDHEIRIGENPTEHRRLAVPEGFKCRIAFRSCVSVRSAKGV
jgi:hypothetical protein